MRYDRATGLLLACLVIGCSPKPKLECLDEAAKTTTLNLVRTELEKPADLSLDVGDEKLKFDRSALRAIVQRLDLSLEDIRTTKEDPTSTKRFCSGILVVHVPDTVLRDAEDYRTSTNLVDLSHMADESDVKRQANNFSFDFEFDAQYTDDGTKIYVQTTDMPKITTFFSEVMADSLAKPYLERKHLEQQRLAAAAATSAAADLQVKLVQARIDDRLANQTITAVWRNIPADGRAALLDAQRAWIGKKTADCDVEAASASVDPAASELAKLTCDVKATQDRTEFLKQYSSSPATSPPSDQPLPS